MNDRGPLTETTTECTNIHFDYYCDDKSTNIHIHYYCAGESALTWGRTMSSPMMVRVRRSGAHQANNEKLKNLRREEFISHLLVQGENICLLFLNVVQSPSNQILISFCFCHDCAHFKWFSFQSGSAKYTKEVPPPKTWHQWRTEFHYVT